MDYKVPTTTRLVTIHHSRVDSLPPFHPLQHLPPLVITNRISVSVRFSLFHFVCLLFVCFLDSVYEWEHMVVVFLCLTYCPYHNTVKVHSCCQKCQDSIPFYGWIAFHYVYVAHLLYPFIHQWILRLSPLS